VTFVVNWKLVFETSGHLAVVEKHWDIVPEAGKVLLGELQWDFDPSYSVVVIQQASLESDFEKILQ